MRKPAAMLALLFMGMFSSKKKIFVASKTLPLFQTNPNRIADAITAAVYAKLDLTTAIEREMSNGLFSKAEAYYRYGRKYYTGGLPTVSYNNYNIKADDMKRFLMHFFGGYTDITVLGYSLEGFSAEWFAYLQMRNSYKWNIDTNTFPDYPNRKFDSAELFDNNTKIRIKYRDDPSFPEEVRDVGIDTTGDFLYIRYMPTPTTDTAPFIHIYRIDDNLWPEFNLDKTTKPDYYPVVTLRHNKVNVDVDKTTPKYITTEKLMKRMGMNTKSILEALMSTEDGNDPNNLDEAFILIAASLSSENNTVRQYLAQFFKDWSENSLVDETKFNENLTQASYAPYNTITFQEGDYNLLLKCNWIKVTEYTGVYTGLTKGKVAIEYTVRPRAGAYLYTYDNSSYTLVYQYAANNYRTIEVRGLEHTQDIYAAGLIVNNTESLKNVQEAADSAFIPINRTSLKKFNPVKQNEIITLSTNLSIYAVQVVYVKWYQRAKILKLIAAVVFVVVSVLYPPASAATGSLLAVLTTVVINLIVQIIVAQILFKVGMYIGEKIGGDLGAALAAITAVASIALSPSNLPMAIDFLNVALGMMAGVNKSTMEALEDLQEEMDTFFKQAKDYLDSMKDEVTGLVSQDRLQYLTQAMGLAYPYEGLDDYLDRTLYNDSTALSLSVIDTYVDARLELPKTTFGA